MSTNRRVYMDSDMLESYANYNEAANHFLDGIALENITLDTELQIEFGFVDDDMFSDHAMEAIGETVKNMASKAKSNFVTYAKKLINFLFGWLIRFFQGAVNVKKTMRSAYEKANTYLKKLNELERKARGSNKEEKIEITDWGNCVLVGLTMIQAVIVSSQNIGTGLSQAAKAGNGTSDSGDGKKASTTRAFKMLDELLNRLNTLYALIGAIDISKPNDLISKLRGANFNIQQMIAGYKDAANKAESSAGLSAGWDTAKQTFKKGRKGLKEAYDDFGAKANEANVKKNKNLEGTYKSRLEATAQYMSEPNKAEMSLMEAYDELRTKLKLFLDISKNNNWDLEKNITAAEKIRRGLEKEINSIELNDVNEKVVATLLQRVIDVGNNLGQIQRSAGVVVKQISKCIEGMTVDVAKLGSRLIKIGDTE